MSSDNPSTPDCRFGIELTKEINVYNVTGRPQAWRLRVTVSDYFNIDPNIFVYMRTGLDPLTNEPQAAFQSVASPTDMEEFPAGIPDMSQPNPSLFFRMSEVDIVSRNKELLEETWALILSDRDELIRTKEKLCTLTVDAVSRGGRWETDNQPVGAT